MIATDTKHKYYPALDGLRGLAILLVVLLHNFGFLHYFFYGWLGVDLFFVLSGFLITGSLLDERDSKNFLKRFYLKRVLRIFPVYFTTIFFCLVILPFLTPSLKMDYYWDHLLWFITFLQNWLFIFEVPPGNPIMLHFWSLAVEEQFYLVWPWVVLFIKKPARFQAFIIFVLISIILARILLWSLQLQDLAYYTFYTFTRIDGLCVGSFIASLWRTHPDFLRKYTPVIVLSLAALNFLMYFINKNAASTLPYFAFIGYSTFAIMFGFILYDAVTEDSRWISILLNNSLMKFFGKISFGLYVYHWPIYLTATPFFEKLVNKLIEARSNALFLSSVISTLLAVLVSFLSYKYFERYFLNLKAKLN